MRRPLLFGVAEYHLLDFAIQPGLIHEFATFLAFLLWVISRGLRFPSVSLSVSKRK